MNTPTPPNTDLARLFFDVMSRTSTSSFSLRDATKRIREHRDSIAEIFQKEGSLQSLKIGLTKKFYLVLENILRDGFEKAGDQAVTQDVASQRRNAFRGVPGSAAANIKPESTSPDWENAIKAQED